MFSAKGVLKIWKKLTGEHPCRSAILIKLQANFIKITLRRGFFPANLLHIFRILFLKNTLGGLLLNQYCFILCLENIIHYPPYPKRHVQKTKIFILIYSFYLKLLKNDHEKIGFAVTF